MRVGTDGKGPITKKKILCASSINQKHGGSNWAQTRGVGADEGRRRKSERGTNFLETVLGNPI
jgi:hypothetical protein